MHATRDKNNGENYIKSLTCMLKKSQHEAFHHDNTVTYKAFIVRLD